jgi:hypothetical protein
MPGFGDLQRLHTILGTVDLPSLAGEAETDENEDAGLVVHREYVHAVPPR